MKDEGYLAVICAILYGNNDDEKEKAQRTLLLDHLLELHYQLEVIAHFPLTQTMVLYIFNEDSCRQYAANSDELYTLEVGHHTDFKLKFAVARFSGENRKVMVRSGSFLKRLVSLDRKEYESISLSTLPLNTFVKKTVFYKGHQYVVDLKVMEHIDRSNMPRLDFDDLLDLMQTLHEHDAENATGEYSGDLSDRSFAILQTAVNHSNVPPEAVKIATLSIFLVWDGSKAVLEELAITRLVKQLKSLSGAEKSEILTAGLAHLSDCLVTEIRDVLAQFSHESLFPPDGYHVLKRMNTALKTVVDICMLPMWDECSICDPSPTLTSELVQMVVDCANEWMRREFRPLAEDLKEGFITVQTMFEMMQRNYQSYNLFFHQFNINYVEVALRTIDEKLESFSREYLAEQLSQLNSRQTDQLEIFTKCTMRFYDTLNSLAEFARKNRVKELLIYEFETWFLGITVFWTYSWRDISLKMVSRTISLNDDGDAIKYQHRRPLPAGLYSFLCIQKGLSDDYAMLSFKLPENIMMGSVALVHIYAENIYAYAKKLHGEALLDDSDYHSRIIRAANGIEQAIAFVTERWRRFVDFERMAMISSTDEVTAIERSCEHVLEGTTKRCDQIIEGLLRLYCRSKRDELTKIAKNITAEHTEHSKMLGVYGRESSPSERMHAILDSIDRMACDVRGDLLSRCSQIAFRILHKMLETEILRHLRKLQTPDYYTEIYVALKAMCSILEIPPEYSHLTSLVHMHSFTTEELILSYYSQIAETVDNTTSERSPRVTAQVGYIPTTGDNALIIVNVVGLENVPDLNTLSDRMDPFVRLELLPACHYPPHCFPVQKTRTLSQCGYQKWNQDFQFLVPLQLFYTNGSSLCISVLDHDRICDDLIGRAFLPTSQMTRLDSLSVKRLPPPQGHCLIQPGVGHKLPFYKMLKERSPHDNTAKAFIRREKAAKEMYFKNLSRRFSTRLKNLKRRSMSGKL
ncbi:hypothetical protein Q1695_010630 [Nippostrongylus brasiliensis]|nr:hypothetical protein Q1695_010630 [Nippostrongylus brasiliensis]